eukprot:CAMPEP_0172414434 /NCGR_PEP_ID=MMETSP1064-20121228/1091_1 /TAXON_ID=202472 /ORGANISM="Aulacoseira subarctica , Strain CCAP 1002/5" /LENGTH=787 /DNA_ID=CAMNT_0013151099 /DNA_START=276 /DNA_END=2639 /DNA_ORIENTATION=-
MATQASNDVEAYNTIFSSVIELSGSYVRNNALTVIRSVRDIDCNKRRKFVYHIPIAHDTKTFGVAPPPYELSSSVKYVLPSPTGAKIAKLVEEDTSNSKANNKKRQVIEIWTHGGASLQKRILLSDKIHGKVYTELSKFGGMSWKSGDEDALVYIAERLSPTTKSFFDSSTEENGDKKQGAESVVTTGTQFTVGVGIQQDWGEKYSDVCNPALFLLSVDTGKVAPISNVPGGEGERTEFSFGQPVFSPCGSHVIYTAWDECPRKLGAIYCFQRPSKIYSSSVFHLLMSISNNSSLNSKQDCGERSYPPPDLDYICITPNDRLARSPRVSLATTVVAFLCNSKGFDSHNGCMGLDIIDWDTKDSKPLLSTRRALVEPVFTPRKDSAVKHSFFGLSFPGLFLDYLPPDCFSFDGRYIFCDTQWGSASKSLKISVLDGSVEPLWIDDSTDSHCGNSHQSFLGAFENRIFLFHSEPNRPGSIVAVSTSEKTRFDTTDIKFTLHPIAITSYSPLNYPLEMEAVQWKIINSNPSDRDPDNIIQSILLMPQNRMDGTKPPLIVVPHGGPHSCSSISFMPTSFFLCLQGKYAVLLVNYRGSTGFGQASIDSLPGKAGARDVQDLFTATTSLLEEEEVDASRVGICGGSHGGFLAGHMIGQFPDLFKVAAMRNPVTNIATMVTSTDIADWCYVEALGAGSYDWTKFRPPFKDELNSMHDASPVAHVQNVKSPTLIALGMSDRRVPPSQGLEYYYTLRSKGVATKLLVYKEDDHAIDSPVSEADHWINIKQWFDDHL